MAEMLAVDVYVSMEMKQEWWRERVVIRNHSLWVSAFQGGRLHKNGFTAQMAMYRDALDNARAAVGRNARAEQKGRSDAYRLMCCAQDVRLLAFLVQDHPAELSEAKEALTNGWMAEAIPDWARSSIRRDGVLDEWIARLVYLRARLVGVSASWEAISIVGAIMILRIAGSAIDSARLLANGQKLS